MRQPRSLSVAPVVAAFAQPQTAKQKSMKIILIHADSTTRHQILQTLDELGHIVVAEPDHPGPFILAIARDQPHAVIIGKLPPGIPKEMVGALAEKCPGTPMLWLPEEGTS